jgi:hypothetical protein
MAGMDRTRMERRILMLPRKTKVAAVQAGSPYAMLSCGYYRDWSLFFETPQPKSTPIHFVLQYRRGTGTAGGIGHLA